MAGVCHNAEDLLTDRILGVPKASIQSAPSVAAEPEDPNAGPLALLSSTKQGAAQDQKPQIRLELPTAWSASRSNARGRASPPRIVSRARRSRWAPTGPGRRAARASRRRVSGRPRAGGASAWWPPGGTRRRARPSGPGTLRCGSKAGRPGRTGHGRTASGRPPHGARRRCRWRPSPSVAVERPRSRIEEHVAGEIGRTDGVAEDVGEEGLGEIVRIEQVKSAIRHAGSSRPKNW